QLDIEEMELVVIELPQVPSDAAGALSLPTEVRALRSAIEAAGGLSTPLDARLRALRVDVDDVWYAQQWFRPKAMDVFVVSDEFPAIRHRDLPAGVTRVKYDLERSAIDGLQARREILEESS